MTNKPKIIKVTITNGVTGQPVTVRNKTTGEVILTSVESTGKLTFDLQNFASGYTVGDIIDFSISGQFLGTASVTTSGDAAQTLTVTGVAIISGVTRGVR
jgi:hypothetical protein